MFIRHLALCVVLACTCANAVAREPILFVHGFASSGQVWDTMAARFVADGWTVDELHTLSYDFAQSNVTTAFEVAARVDEILAATGAARVDLVTHSMGGLSTRYFLRFMGGRERVDAWVSLAGPNHGTTGAWLCFTWSCGEMRPLSLFLVALNGGDPTPGATRYGTFWSSCDSVINPNGSVWLTGASNAWVGCIDHISMLSAPAVYAQVRNFVD